MYKTIYKLVFKNRLRLSLGTLRHTWPSLLGIIAAAGILLYQILIGSALIKTGELMSPQIARYILLFLAGLQGLRVLFSPSFTPVICVNAATILLTCSTPLLRRLLLCAWCRKLTQKAVSSLLVSLCLNGFLLDGRLLRLFFAVFLLLSGTSFLAWIGYHGDGWKYRLSVAGAALLSGAFLAPNPISVPALAAVTAAAGLFALFALKLNIPKYYDSLCRIDAATAAQSRMTTQKCSSSRRRTVPLSCAASLMTCFTPRGGLPFL